MTTDTTGAFIFYGGLLLIAIFVCGSSSIEVVPGIIALYFMLVATNAIARGENRARRKAKHKS